MCIHVIHTYTYNVDTANKTAVESGNKNAHCISLMIFP